MIGRRQIRPVDWASRASDVTPELIPTTEQQSRLRERSAPRRSDFAEVALPPLADVPGMISPADCRYLFWLTSRQYCGLGEVVEVGPWLGRSTLHLAAGLLAAGYDDALHCFDQFIWRRNFNAKVSFQLKEGADFLPLFERHVRPVYPKVKVSRQALRDLVWHGGPIEILFLDAPKELSDISATLATFAESLIPGVSLVVMQDYLHWPSYALNAVVSLLARELRLIHEVGTGSTAAFEVVEPLSVRFAQPTAWNTSTWTGAEARARWTRMVEPLRPEARLRLQLGLGLVLHDLGDVTGAITHLRSLGDDARPYLQRGVPLLRRRYPALLEALDLESAPAGQSPPRSRVRQSLQVLRERLRSLTQPAEDEVR